MLSKDFYGKQGYIWFIGVVEDVNDPSQLGQVRVRIIGLHSEDKSLMPTEKLPWAQVIMPPTGAKTFSGPTVGDWVRGYFQDGEFAQIPVVDGIFPGVEGQQSRIVYNYIKEKQGENKTPKSSQHYRESGEGTTFRSVRGVLDGTLTQINNLKLSHSCGVSEQVKTVLAWARIKSSELINSLTATIKAFALKLGLDPTGRVSYIVSFLKNIRRFVNWIRSILEDINDWLQVVRDVIIICKQIVQLILSLPRRLIAFLQDCLRFFMGEISSMLSGIISGIGNAIFDSSKIDDELLGLVGDINRLVSEADQSISLYSETVNETSIGFDIDSDYLQELISPTSVENLEIAEVKMELFISKVANNSEQLVSTSVYSSENYEMP